MTKLSDLAGKAAKPYISGNYYPAVPSDIGGAGAANNDFLMPFTVREAVTIANLFWSRANTTAANVYVGIYDSAGALLTNCAVDANTTAGIHVVSTSAVTLQPGRLYFFCINSSASVASNASSIPNINAYDNGMTVVGTAFGSYFANGRTNAALPSTAVLSGFGATGSAGYGGFVKQ